MSQASRESGDSGDRRRHSSQSQTIVRRPIRFLAPKKRDRRIMVPKELVARADGGKMHRDDLRRELAILWNTYAKYGEFSVSMKMLNELYSSKFREKLKAILESAASKVKNHANYAEKSQCTTYKFNIPLPRKRATYSGVLDDMSSPTRQQQPQQQLDMVHITLPATWAWERYERWSAICVKHDWVQNLDLDGRTNYGRQTFTALEAATVPAVPRTKRLTDGGVPRMVVRRHGRCYDPTTNLPKKIRREMHFNGEPTVELDIHAMYTCLLVAKMKDGEAKDRAITTLQTGWYQQFNPAFSQWFDSQLASGRGYILNGTPMICMDKDRANDVEASPKIEYQRQVLFFLDKRRSSSPLRAALHMMHRDLCDLIERLRDDLSPREFSHLLTRGEGSMIVDGTLSELEDADILAKTIHDAVLVPASQVDAARAILLRVSKRHLGFEPRISIKSGVRITSGACYEDMTDCHMSH